MVLCFLEGLTNQQAALKLGWAPGAVRSRLHRGREQLRTRLIRRGLAPSVGVLTAVLSPEPAWSAVPPPLVHAMARTAVLAEGGQIVAGVVPATILSLSNGVLRAMAITRLKTVAMSLLTAAVSVAGGMAAVGFATHQALTAERASGEQLAVAPQTPAHKKVAIDDLRGKWKGEKNGIKVEVTINGRQASWKVIFHKAINPDQPPTEVRMGADLKCVSDEETHQLALHLPAYLGDRKELKESPSYNGRRAVGQIRAGAEGTIQLSIIPTGYENLAEKSYDYPSVDGLVLRRSLGDQIEKLNQNGLKDHQVLIESLVGRDKTSEEVVEALYDSTLRRDPTAAELDFLAKQIDGIEGTDARRKAIEDMLWSILNSKEFRERQHAAREMP
jgi:hypothetical protein